MGAGNSLTVNGSMWPVVCSGASTCALGNAADLRKPMVTSALGLRWQERKWSWFGAVFVLTKEVLH